MRRVALLGASGSIGVQALQVLDSHSDELNLVSLSVGQNIAFLEEILKKFTPKVVSTLEPCETLAKMYPEILFVHGLEGLKAVVTHSDVDVVLNGISGFAGLQPTIDAIKAKKDIALANKECLVTAGHIVMNLVDEFGVKLVPVDSEHSAIFQSLAGSKKFKRIILTASGGAFRDLSIDELNDVSVEDALKHPNWSMGKKITIDSATMMNKALEIIEARWLFDTKNIDVIIHKESIVHSLVEFDDNSVIAQLGVPSMVLPIQYGLTYPRRLLAIEKQLRLEDVCNLTFAPVDFKKYEAVSIAFELIKENTIMPTIFNAANEVAVDLFLRNKIKFVEIVPIVKEELLKHENILDPTLEDIFRMDREVRERMNNQWG